MSSIPPADNHLRPCGKCGQPRGDSGRHICGPCWAAYQQDYNARKRIREAERRAKPLVPTIALRERRVGSTPGIDGPNLDTW